MDLENKYGTLAIQQELLTLLKEFHACCVANNVKYSLAYGSLLGAIRHKGHCLLLYPVSYHLNK